MSLPTKHHQHRFHSPVALSIAGSDSSGGAGIQADLRHFQYFDVFGTTAITAITAQNGAGVQAVELMPAAMVQAQLQSVLSGMPVAAAKTGMLGNHDIITAVAQTWQSMNQQRQTQGLAPIPLVLDPVMVATSGAALLQSDATQCLLECLLPQATVVTPNLPELAALTGSPLTNAHEKRQAAEQLLQRGCQAVLMKDGHGDGQQIDDVLLTTQGEFHFGYPRLEGEFHGTGCATAASICAGLALGNDLHTTVEQALNHLHERLPLARASLCSDLRYLP